LSDALTPSEFHRRFRAHVLSLPELDTVPELREQLSEFVSFDRLILEEYSLNASEIDFLVQGGLPQSASPFLSFAAYPRRRLAEMYDQCDLLRTLFPLGHNGSGDPLGIELSSHAVVYLNHDDGMRRVFINSSVPRFAESLCMYQELLAANHLGQFLAQIEAIDRDAVAVGTMWYTEVVAGTSVSDSEP
jgi:hypothetical protein